MCRRHSWPRSTAPPCAASVDDDNWNLLKLHTREHAITFLVYPDFDNDPHPALATATKINLRTGTVVRTDFRQRANPPILHRKETFLPPNDPRGVEFAALTRQEEHHGLYREPSKIGLRVYWQTLLTRLGLAYEGHRLCVPYALDQNTVEAGRDMRRVSEGEVADVHRTAIKRYDLSRPVKRLLGAWFAAKGRYVLRLRLRPRHGRRRPCKHGLSGDRLGPRVPSRRQRKPSPVS